MDKLYTLCEDARVIKVDCSDVLGRDKENVTDWLKEIYYNYENELVNANTFYAFFLDVQTVLQRLGYGWIYTLESGVLTMTVCATSIVQNQ